MWGVKEKEVKGDSKDFGLSNWKGEDVIYWDGEGYGRKIMSLVLDINFEIIIRQPSGNIK